LPNAETRPQRRGKERPLRSMNLKYENDHNNRFAFFLASISFEDLEFLAHIVTPDLMAVKFWPGTPPVQLEFKPCSKKIGSSPLSWPGTLPV